jgi:outer membrane protein assembly factor BamB
MKKYLPCIAGIITVVCTSAQTDFRVISTKTEKEVIPEGITINPASGMIYVSSIALKKIIAIDNSGSHKDFIKSNQDGFLEGLGMKIDEKKQWLWAVSNQKQGEWFISQVQAFDLKTNSVKQKYAIKDTIRHLFNDLILHPNGKIYITDTYGSSIYEADPAKQKLSVFVHDSLIAYPNGITSGTRGKIYIATYSHGLIQLDARSKKLSPLKGYIDSVKAFSLDGLVYWKNTIVGVYNGAKNNIDNVIVQYFLDDDGNKIVSERIIDKGNKFFREPTTAAVFGNHLYVLSNSCLAAYNANKESVEGIEDKLDPVMILVYTLQ